VSTAVQRSVPQVRFSQYSPEFAARPLEMLDEFRAAPVVYSSEHDGFYVFTRWDDVKQILLDPLT